MNVDTETREYEYDDAIVVSLADVEAWGIIKSGDRRHPLWRVLLTGPDELSFKEAGDRIIALAERIKEERRNLVSNLGS